MKTAAAFIMIVNAALFIFGAVQHVGIPIGPFHEPVIIPAAIVESLCAISLLTGVTTFYRSPAKWRFPLIANLVAMAGVLLGMVALAAGRGPRTASNDWYHRIMLVLIAGAVVFLFAGKRKPSHSQG